MVDSLCLYIPVEYSFAVKIPKGMSVLPIGKSLQQLPVSLKYSCYPVDCQFKQNETGCITLKGKLDESGLSTETNDAIKTLDTLQTQTDQIPEARQKLISIVNKYLDFTEQYYSNNGSSLDKNVENKNSLDTFKAALTRLNNSIDSLNNLTDFQNFTGYSPSEIIKGVEDVSRNKEATVTIVDVSLDVIKDNINKNYQTQIFNTDFQNYIEDRIEPAEYRINL
jgi:hypothetical protein